MTQVKKDLIIGLIIGVIATIFFYQAYAIQRLRPVLIQNRIDLEVLNASVGQIVDFLNQATAQVNQ